MGSARAKRKLFTRGVAVAMAAMVASCQRSLGSPAREGGVSVTGEALLAPRVAIDVIAAQLPEARLLLPRKLQAAHPFRRLPEIEMRHQQPGRPAMVGLKRLPRIVERVERDHGLAADEVGEWHIGGVAVEGMGKHELGRRRGEGC